MPHHFKNFLLKVIVFIILSSLFWGFFVLAGTDNEITGLGHPDEVVSKSSLEKLYQEGRDALEKGNCYRALPLLEKFKKLYLGYIEENSNTEGKILIFMTQVDQAITKCENVVLKKWEWSRKDLHGQNIPPKEKERYIIRLPDNIIWF